MSIVINGENYDTGIHPEVTKIMFEDAVPKGFFETDRFPNLVNITFFNTVTAELHIVSQSLEWLFCSNNKLTELSLNCPSLQHLHCADNCLTKISLNCPSLLGLYCSCNSLTELNIRCPLLETIRCDNNKITEFSFDCPRLVNLYCHKNPLENLNGLEFCSMLSMISCPRTMNESLKLLYTHIPHFSFAFN